MPWKVAWSVTVDGVDMSDRMNDFILSIEVTDKDGSASDTATLKFSDTDAQMFLPKDGARVVIALMGVVVFEGTVDEVRSSGARGSGRELTVSCKGFDSRGKVKEPLSFHKDNTTLESFLGDAAKRAGLKGVTIDQSFKGIQRPFWSADGETILHLGKRLAEELGGSFKIRGDKAVFAKRGEGKTPSGQDLPSVRAVWGDNLMTWDVAPFMGRKRFTKARVRYFDRKEAKWKEEDVEVSAKDGAPPSVDVVRFPKADKAEAKGAAKGRKTDSEREGGEGSVKIDLDPAARAEGSCIIEGARPGVDGLYRIVSVTHRLTRSGGSETSLELKQPQGDAGKDKRKSKP